jgi:CheY-like chemotaxis protein
MSNRKSILVVHDDPSVISRIRPVLEILGYDVTATTSDDVHAVFLELKPSYVVLAPCVPRTKREQIPAALKAVRPDITVFQLDSLLPETLQRQLTQFHGKQD